MELVTAESVGLSSERLERLDRRMQAYIDGGTFAGIMTAIARRGKLAHLSLHGMADIASGRPMAEDAIFRIYSMTKPITSVAVLMLYEECYFHLFDPVSNYIPAFKGMKVLTEDTPLGRLVDAHREITIHDLLTHTAGLSYGGNPESEVDRMITGRLAELGHDRRSASIEEVVDVVTSAPLAYQPGSSWRYSLATDVLGYLVQVVSGMPFGEFLAKRILGPLGMVDTFFQLPEDKVNRAATVYGPGEDGGLKPLFPPEARRVNAFDSGGGGLYSTMPDYLRFAQMLLNMGELEGVRLLGRKAVELMTMNHLPDGLYPFENRERGSMGFGLGVGVAIDVAASRALGSLGTYGWGGAAGTGYLADPHEEMSMLLMVQIMGGGPYQLAPDFRALAYQAIVD